MKILYLKLKNIINLTFPNLYLVCLTYVLFLFLTVKGDYKYVVALLDEDVGETEKPIVRMCVDFELPTSAPRLVSSA